MGVYLQSITESIPPTSEAVPLIGMYYIASLTIVCLATAMNVITLNINRRGATNQGRRIPWWMEKYVLGYMATFLRMKIHEPDSIALLKISQTKRTTIHRNSILRDLKRIKNMDNLRIGERKGNDLCDCLSSTIGKRMTRKHNGFRKESSDENERNFHYHQSETKFLEGPTTEQLVLRINASDQNVLTEFEVRFQRILRRIYRSLQQHEIREEVIDERERIKWQWRQLASIIDRFLLILFSFITFLTVAFFLIIPVVFRDQMGTLFPF